MYHTTTIKASPFSTTHPKIHTSHPSNRFLWQWLMNTYWYTNNVTQIIMTLICFQLPTSLHIAGTSYAKEQMKHTLISKTSSVITKIKVLNTYHLYYFARSDHFFVATPNFTLLHIKTWQSTFIIDHLLSFIKPISPSYISWS